MKQRIDEQVTSCSKDVSQQPADGLKSFTEIDDFGVNVALTSITKTLKENYMNRSSNFIGTYIHFIESLRQYYNTLNPSDPSSSTFVSLTDAQYADMIKKVAGVGMHTIIYHEFGEWEQNMMGSLQGTIRTNIMIIHSGVQSFEGLIYPETTDTSNLTALDKFAKHTSWSGARLKVKLIYYYWRSIVYRPYKDLSNLYDNLETYNNFRFVDETDNDIVEVPIYKTSLQNLIPGNP